MAFACVCSSVTDSMIVKRIELGDTTIESLMLSLGVCSNCGCCRQYIEKLISDNIRK